MVRNDFRSVVSGTKQLTPNTTMTSSKIFPKDLYKKEVFCPNPLYVSKFFPPPILNYWFMHSFQKKRGFFLNPITLFYSTVILQKAQSYFARQTVNFVGDALGKICSHTCLPVCTHTHTFYTFILQKTKLAS